MTLSADPSTNDSLVEIKDYDNEHQLWTFRTPVGNLDAPFHIVHASTQLALYVEDDGGVKIGDNTNYEEYYSRYFPVSNPYKWVYVPITQELVNLKTGLTLNLYYNSSTAEYELGMIPPYALDSFAVAYQRIPLLQMWRIQVNPKSKLR